MGIMVFQPLWIACLAEAYLLGDRLEDALALCERGHEAWIFRLLGEIAMHRHPQETELAETHYHQVLTVANELDMRPLQAHCHRGLGTLYLQTGQIEQARAALATAIDWLSAPRQETCSLPRSSGW